MSLYIIVIFWCDLCILVSYFFYPVATHGQDASIYIYRVILYGTLVTDYYSSRATPAEAVCLPVFSRLRI